ncbi:hypothetical protein [Candidatus Uabimicrobium sp. HlEnr_7]|uniref:hypothetical protein n=1 Tax=Candidatus Uabimicrobium helgolandensis TaxID=3095367 RepID=UPI003556F826
MTSKSTKADPRVLAEFPFCGYCGKEPKFLVKSSHTPVGWNIAFASLGASVSYNLAWALCEECSKRPKKYLLRPWLDVLFAIGVNYIYFQFFAGNNFRLFDMFLIMLVPISLLTTAVKLSKNTDNPFVIERVYDDHSMDIRFENENVQKKFEDFVANYEAVKSTE